MSFWYAASPEEEVEEVYQPKNNVAALVVWSSALVVSVGLWYAAFAAVRYLFVTAAAAMEGM